MKSVPLWLFRLIAGLVVSTIYLRYHLVIDLITGVVIAVEMHGHRSSPPCMVGLTL